MRNNENEFTRFRNLSFMKSRIPALDALTVFIPEGQQPQGKIKETMDRIGFSRWFPEKGGHKVQLPYEGGEYEKDLFQIEKKAWDHEHCKICNVNIPSMTLCWVTTSEPYIIFCESCHSRMESERLAQQ